MSEKITGKQGPSDVVRDVIEPGWREREAACGPPLTESLRQRTTICPFCAAPPHNEHGTMCGLHPMQARPLAESSAKPE